MTNLGNFRSVHLKLDKANDYQVKPQFAKQGDYNGRDLIVQITDGGEVKEQLGVKLNLGWKHQTIKNQGLDPFEVVDVEKGIFKITYPAEMMNPGTVICAIQIIDKDKVTLTKNFKVEVEKSPFDDDVIIRDNSFTVLQEALIQINQWDSEFQKKYDGLEEEYAKDLTLVSTQLAEKVKSINQADYVKLFKNKHFTHSGIIKRSETEIELFSQNDYEGVRYLLTKDPTDEFFKLGQGGFYSNQENIEPTVSGSWSTTGLNWYATDVGDSFTIEYEGTGIDLRYHTDSRGGVWELNIDGEIVTISTYSNTEELKTREIRHSYGKKRIVGVFKGADPTTGVENPRGWLRSSQVARGTMKRRGLVELLHPTSNKEFAFRIRYGDNPSVWYPEHNGQGVMYDNVFSYHVDGVNFTSEIESGEVIIGKSVSVQQAVAGYYDNSKEVKLADFQIQHVIDLDGIIDYRGRMVARNSFVMTTGYPLMLAVNSAALNKVVTSYGSAKENAGDDSEYYFTKENGEATSVVFTTSISGYGSYVAFATLDEATKTMLYGEEGSPPPSESIFFWQRETVPKFYFKSIDHKNFASGDIYRWSGKIGIGRHQAIATYL